MFDIIPNFISGALGVVLPLYLSHRAQNTHNPNLPYPTTNSSSTRLDLDPSLLQAFLLYFSVLSLLLTFENLFLWVTYLIPFYAWLRMIFILYLALPQTQGAKLLYSKYVAPFFGEYGGEIEGLIKRGHDVGLQAGFSSRGQPGTQQDGRFGILSSLGSVAGGMLGTVAPAWLSGNQNVHPPGAPLNTTAPTSYADSLLSRFRMTSSDGLAYGKAYGIPDPASFLPGVRPNASPVPGAGGFSRDSARPTPTDITSSSSSATGGYTSYVNAGISQATDLLSGAAIGSRNRSGYGTGASTDRDRESGKGSRTDKRRVVSGGSYRSNRLDDSDLDSMSEDEGRQGSHRSSRYDGERRKGSGYRD